MHLHQAKGAADPIRPCPPHARTPVAAAPHTSRSRTRTITHSPRSQQILPRQPRRKSFRPGMPTGASCWAAPCAAPASAPQAWTLAFGPFSYRPQKPAAAAVAAALVEQGGTPGAWMWELVMLHLAVVGPVARNSARSSWRRSGSSSGGWHACLSSSGGGEGS